MSENADIIEMFQQCSIVSSIYNCDIHYIIDIDNKFWFRAVDIATVFNYQNTRKAIIDHVDDEDKLTYEEVNMRRNISLPQNQTLTKASQPHTIYINESGLVSLSMLSKKAEAKTFKRWITSEIIPAILRTGSYTMPKNEVIENKLTHNQFNM